MTTGFPARKGKLIMVVDDTWDNLLYLQSVIESEGYTCLAVPSGPECLELVNRAPPKLVLLDIEMPSMDGFETCRRLRRLSFMRRVPIVFVTARKSVEAVRAGIAAGGNDFVLKPFEPARLVERIDHWVATPLPG